MQARLLTPLLHFAIFCSDSFSPIYLGIGYRSTHVLHKWITNQEMRCWFNFLSRTFPLLWQRWPSLLSCAKLPFDNKYFLLSSHLCSTFLLNQVCTHCPQHLRYDLPPTSIPLTPLSSSTFLFYLALPLNILSFLIFIVPLLEYKYYKGRTFFFF